MSDAFIRLNAALEGRYRVERQLGEGGMATVYLANDLRHERKVALKVLKPELAAVVGAERFLAEIKTTANLQHPHILPLFDSGEADGFLFYVMPYVEGESLRERLDREHQLPVDDAVRIAANVAEALDYAHGHGVIHRDIKPANILLQAGKPVISDFGIALAVTAGGAGRLTETGLSLGTPHYMSPEQATGDLHVGAATDIYALGCVLYEMLVGEPPYTGSTPQAILGKIVVGEPDPVTKHRRSVPANVDAAIRRALEKVPADRFGAAGELARALGDAAFRHGASAAVGEAAASASGAWNRLSRALAASTALMTLVAAWSLLRPEAGPPALAMSRQLFSTEGWDGVSTLIGRYAALAPDGSSMILPVGGQLAVKMRNSTEITPIAGTEGAHDVVYSPDGAWIAYAIGSDLFKRPLVGGAPVRLGEADQSDLALDWLDDGTIWYEQATNEPGRERRIVRIPENGGVPEVVFWPEERVTPVWVHGLPDGRGALVVACVDAVTCNGSQTHSLFVVDLRDGSNRRVLDVVVRAWYTPTGHIIYVGSAGAVFAQPFDLETLEVRGGAVPLWDGVRMGVQADMRLARDGTILYVESSSTSTGPGTQLVVVDLEGNQQALPLAPRSITWVGWSSDGESVVYAGDTQIYVYDVVRNTTPRQLTFEGVNNNPVVSPDGTRVVFSSVRGGTSGSDLYVKSLKDDTPARSLATLDSNQVPVQWPNDTLIAFLNAPGSNALDLWMLDLSDPEEPEARPYLTSEATLAPWMLSPDGTLAAYASNETGTVEAYVRSFPEPGERTVVSRGGGDGPYWSPDGNTLYYNVREGAARTMVAARLRRDPVPIVLSWDTLFSVTNVIATIPPQALHPDGDRFIFGVRAGGTEGNGGGAEEGESRPARLILVQNFFEELKRLAPN